MLRFIRIEITLLSLQKMVLLASDLRVQASKRRIAVWIVMKCLRHNFWLDESRNCAIALLSMSSLFVSTNK